MRRWVILPVTLLMLAVPTMQAQEPVALLEEDSGDVAVQLAAENDGSALQDRFDHGDLQSLVLREGPESFVFELTVASLQVDEDNLLFEHGEWTIHFGYEGIHYAVEVYRWVPLDSDPDYYAYVGQVPEGSEYIDTTGAADIIADEAAGTMTVTVSREDIFDDNGASPFPGRQLDDFYVESTVGESGVIWVNGEPVVGFTGKDRMPDDGVGPGYEVLLGIEQSELASLGSPEPMRVSNGGATTVVYDVEASNMDDKRHVYSLALSEVPDGWQVSLPFDRFSLDANETRSFPVLLVTPSGHAHGGIDRFRLEMKSERDERAFGQLELGLRYTEIPQPAGHHPKMWFHSFERPTDPLSTAIYATLPYWQPVYMNAAEEDPMDSQQATPAIGSTITGLESEYWWEVYMSPSLRMGLDFDMARTGTIEVPVHYLYVMQDAQLSGTIYLYDPSAEDTLVLADITASQPVSIGPDATHTFELAIQPKPEADFVEYETGMSMWMELRLRGVPVAPGPFGPEVNPTLEPGGFMELPLNEYRDPVSAFYRAVEGLSFSKEFVESDVNPGKTRIFRVQLENAGDAKDTVDLNLTGTHLDWSRILGKSSFDMAPGATREIAVAVSVPEGIEDGAIADLAVIASSQENPFRRAVVDLVAVVDTEADHPDDSGDVARLDDELSKGKKSPGFEVAALVAILAAIVAVLPRRR